ncbi:MAG: metallophosphoesterase family protein [Patescibacteria group bacterium]
MGKIKTRYPTPAATQSVKVREFIDWLKGGSRTVREVSEHLGIAKINVYYFVSELRERHGYDIVERGDLLVLRREPIPGEPIKLKGTKRRTLKIGFLAKVGIGLKTFQGTILATAFEYFKKENVNFAVVVDLTGGRPGRKDGSDFMERLGDFPEKEIDDKGETDNEGKQSKKKKKKFRGGYYFEDQVKFAVKHLSRLAANLPFKVYVVGGERDMRHKTEYGQNIIAAICQQVKNFVYAGDIEQVFPIGSDNCRLIVADSGENTPYTKSYTAQGTAENYQSAITPIIEKYRPDVLVLAGSHVFSYKPRSTKREKKLDDNDIDVIQLPSLYSLPPSKMTKKRRGGSHEIGFVILSLDFNQDGTLKDLEVECSTLTAYQKIGDYFEDNNFPDDLSEDKKKIIAAISDFPRRLGALSRLTNKPKSEVQKIIESLRKRLAIKEENGYYQLKKPWVKKYQPIPLDRLYVNSHKTVDFSDLHIGNEESRADEILPEIEKIIEREKLKPDAVICTGDIFDGVDNHPGQDQELIDRGADEQVDHGVRIWPRWRIPTYIIRGSSHEAKLLRVGHDMVEHFVEKLHAKGYGYIEYIGDRPKNGRAKSNKANKGVTEIKKIKVMLFHPTGGIPFGLSYRLQQVVERIVAKNATSGARRIDCGHLHVAYAMVYKGILAKLNSCLEEQTNYEASRMLIPDLGFWITRIHTDNRNNLTRVVLKYYPSK